MFVINGQSIGLGLPNRGSVAIVRIEGLIMDASDSIRLLRSYARNPAVRAILLRIESSGGAVGSSQELYHEVLKTRRESGKKIVASMGNVAASGGYYIASAADEIFANAGTLTGSIGVVLETYNLQGISEKIGVGVNVIKSGAMKDVGSPFREMTPEERAVLQTTINDTYDQFLDAILDGRQDALARACLKHSDKRTTATAIAGTVGGTLLSRTDETTVGGTLLSRTGAPPREKVKDYLRTFADGRVLSGRQALELGLVDRLGGFHDAIDRAAELGGIRGRPTLLQERRKHSLWELLRGRSSAVSRLIQPNGFSLQYRVAFE